MSRHTDPHSEPIGSMVQLRRSVREHRDVVHALPSSSTERLAASRDLLARSKMAEGPTPERVIEIQCELLNRARSRRSLAASIRDSMHVLAIDADRVLFSAH